MQAESTVKCVQTRGSSPRSISKSAGLRACRSDACRRILLAGEHPLPGTVAVLSDGLLTSKQAIDLSPKMFDRGPQRRAVRPRVSRTGKH